MNSTLGLAVLAVLLGTASLSAHSELERAEPAADSTVSASPREVAIWFTQTLEPAFSAITVQNAAGQRVDAGASRVTGNQIRVPLKPIGAGTYRVNWRVLSVDTHRTQGSYRFHVKP